MIRIVQLQNGPVRRVARVEEPRLRLIDRFTCTYDLAMTAAAGESLLQLVERHVSDEWLDYDPIYEARSAWKLLAPIDHPGDPARCSVTGTGLTHFGSARNRDAMHAAVATETDSMRMFKWGVEGGRPAANSIGVAPEWFFKGVGTILRAPGEPLTVPDFGEDGGEEAEVAGIYVIDSQGRPRRVGMAIGNEFSDHKFERRNYLNLAGSKLRSCSLGPELVLDPQFDRVPGTAKIERAGAVVWSKEIATGESEMCHSLSNIEHHHFKFDAHRRPGDLHVHYFGAHSLSFGDGVELRDGDLMVVEFAGFGRPLRNPLIVARSECRPVAILPLA